MVNSKIVNNETVYCIFETGSQSTKVELNPVTKTLKRSSALSRTNPDDLYALQMALDLKRDTAAEVVQRSAWGRPRQKPYCATAFAAGADRAILLSSPAFAGSDTLVYEPGSGCGCAQDRSVRLVVLRQNGHRRRYGASGAGSGRAVGYSSSHLPVGRRAADANIR